MSTRSINRKVIGHLKELSDDKEVHVTQNKHIKVTGLYGGEKRSFVLACSPFSNYQKTALSALRRFIRSIPLQVNPTDFSL